MPHGATDARLDTVNAVRYSLEAGNLWLDQTIRRKLRFDTYQGQIDIRFFELPASFTGAAWDYGLLRQQIETELRLAGQIDPRHRYLVFAEVGGSQYCAGSLSPSMVAQGERAAVVFLRATSGGVRCDSLPYASSPTAEPGWTDYMHFHELFHVLGAPHVAEFEPNPTPSQLCDLMFGGLGRWCFDRRLVDPNGLYYYNPAGFADARPNVYFSPFLTPASPASP